MDTVTFTGNLSEEELRTERPAQYEEMKKNGALDRLAVSAPSRRLQLISHIFWGTALLFGSLLVFIIICAFLK